MIVADAPDGFSAQDLGVPLDAAFNRMVGGGAGSMFPQAGPPIYTPMGKWYSERNVVNTNEELSANARAWSINVSAGYGQGHRYGYYRATQLTGAYGLRLDTPMSPPPPGAVYFASKVYIGHSYSVIVEGDAWTFNAGVGAEFMVFGGAVNDFTQRYRLQQYGLGRGLYPANGTALFAAPENVARHYVANKDAPDAIIIEYRQIPYTQVSVSPTAPRPRIIDIRFTNLQVGSTGSILLDYSNWTLWGQCNLNGRAYGSPVQLIQNRVSVGPAPLVFDQQIPASDGDNIECSTWGTYTRMGGVNQLGRSSTGLMQVGQINGLFSSAFTGVDSDTKYTITWTASKLQ